MAQETPESTQRSLEILQQGLEQQPDSSRLWRALAAAHERREEYDEALNTF
jgi:cytochrome c-type biogenesis protein CcmH/NrfG